MARRFLKLNAVTAALQIGQRVNLMRRLIAAALAALVALVPVAATAQDHSFPTPGNASVGGAVDMFLNPSGNAIPVSAANPFPVTIISGGGGGGSVTQGTSPWVDNITQWASVTLGAATAWGTAPTGNVPGVNANILGPLGQQLPAASVPVVLPAAQITILTPPTTVTSRVVGNAGGVFDAIGQNVAAPANWLATGCQFFTTPTTLTNGNGSPCQMDNAGNLLVNLKTSLPAGSNIIGKAGIDQTTPGTTNNVTVGPVNSSPTNFSATTSGTPSTATTLLAASATHQKVVIKVEGAMAVCFSQFGTAVIGAAGTWCLKGASTANAGDGGSYVTPGGMSEPNAISMISTGTSILVTGWWQ
jgi:hypothetical protein